MVRGQATEPRSWADDHVGVAVELQEAQWTIESTSDRGFVVLRGEQNETRVAKAEVVRRAYLRQYGGEFAS